MTTSLRETYVRRDHAVFQQLGRASINDVATRITLHRFNYPDGWTPGTADLLLRYPDTYPRMQPAVYIPKRMEYNGRVAHRLTATEDLHENWVRWCTHHIDWQTWRQSCRRKEQQPIVQFVGLIQTSLRFPHKSNPIKHAQRRR